MTTSLRAVAVLLAISWLSGCPRDPQHPEPGPSAMECEALEDCNEGRACGNVPLRVCVDGLCAEEATLVRPCLPGP
jgi:hypothetical protein